MMKSHSCFIYFLITLISLCLPIVSYSKSQLQLCESDDPIKKEQYFISTTGNNHIGDGSQNKPWKSIQGAINKVPDGSTILAKPGVYEGSTNIKKRFDLGIIIKSEVPYAAKLTNNKRVIAFTSEASRITLEGFEITHSSTSSSPLVVHVDGGGTTSVNHITIKNNIIHDSFNNDLLKINNGAENIIVSCNMFYNQGDSDEHIDINSVNNIDITGNLFFNSFEMSNRQVSGKSSSFIVIKDSSDNSDNILGSGNINIDRNIFFNWQGSIGHGYILIGEDGKSYYEATDVSIFNNLFLGNSNISMRSPLGIKGAKNIYFYNNTVTGDLPSNAYAIRINREGDNPINNNIALFNNIWNDTSGTMGQGKHELFLDFSDVEINQLDSYYFNNNLVYNGGNKIPYSFLDKINPADDKKLKSVDPEFPEQIDLIIPRWIEKKQKFTDGSPSIEKVYINLLYLYGLPKSPHILYDITQEDKNPKLDIRGNTRTTPYSLGAFEQVNN